MNFVDELVEQRRRFVEAMVLAVALPGVAGAVNAAGVMAIGAYTSHVTGMVARFGDEIAYEHFNTAAATALLVMAFLVGAMAATVCVELARRRGTARYWHAVVLEIVLLAAFGVIAAQLPEAERTANLGLTLLVTAAMGLQNAMVSRLSGAVVRTTHMTGVVTDIGIESVRLAFLAREVSARGGKRSTWREFMDTEGRRLVLLCTIFASFVSGAIAGPLVYLWIGLWSVAVPCGVLALLAGIDYAIGLRWHPDAHLPPQASAASSGSSVRMPAVKREEPSDLDDLELETPVVLGHRAPKPDSERPEPPAKP
ncbi:MAG: DUF1275 domain-containing protein [Planctomycetes bacterium]|nr:DUF1275 domain-containing protein [Planctomycetota bacterium]